MAIDRDFVLCYSAEMLKAFFLGGAAIVAAFMGVALIAVAIGGHATIDACGAIGLFAVGGVLGVIVRTAYVKGRKSTLGTSEPIFYANAGGSQEPIDTVSENPSARLRVLERLLGADATVPSLIWMFPSAQHARPVIRSLLADGSIELLHKDGRSIALSEFDEFVQSNARGIGGLQDITVQITEIGAERIA
jgi:hypothetical protein